MVGRLLQGILLFAAYFCVASTAAQAVGLGLLYTRGGLTREKISQYAAVLYGFDIAASGGNGEQPVGKESEVLPRSVQLARSADEHPSVRQRKAAVVCEQTAIDERERELQKRTESHDLFIKSLEDLLAKLETDATTTALAEVQTTLEIVPPMQAKDLLLRMLEDQAVPEKEALDDVANILKTMASEKLKKILAEFKSDPERQSLHRILVHLGNIRPRAQEQQP